MIEQVPHDLKDDEHVEVLNLYMNPKFSPIFAKINEEYLYWDKVKYLAPEGISNRHLWFAVKLQRSARMQRLSFGGYNFYFNVTPSMYCLLHEFDLNMGGNISSNSIIPDKDKQLYLISSLMEEAIASSQMEGASTTRVVAKEMLRKQESPVNKSQQMIVNNYNTIRELVERKVERLDMALLLDVHKSISFRTLENPQDEGRIRQSDDVYVVDAITGEVAHTPPTHSDIEHILMDLFAFANRGKDDEFIHPIVKGIIIHFVMAWIHPFVDGNGRTARSLVYWYLLKKDYWLTEYLSISRVIYNNKSRYERAFLQTEADGMDMTYFILYNLQVMKQAIEDLRKYLARKMEERRTIQQYAGMDGLSERQMYILHLYDETPSLLLTAVDVANRYGVTEKTARIDLQALVAIGKLTKIALNKKKSGYVQMRDNS